MIATSPLHQLKFTECKHRQAPLPSHVALGCPCHKIGKAASQVGRHCALSPPQGVLIRELSLIPGGLKPSKELMAMPPAQSSHKLFGSSGAAYLYGHCKWIRKHLRTTRRLRVVKCIRGHNEGEDKTRTQRINPPCSKSLIRCLHLILIKLLAPLPCLIPEVG